MRHRSGTKQAPSGHTVGGYFQNGYERPEVRCAVFVFHKLGVSIGIEGYRQ